MMALTIATSATRPIVRPTAPPVLMPELLWLFDTGATSGEFGATVGVEVTVCTIPVTVSTEVTGVGVHVEGGELEVMDVEVDKGLANVGVGVVAGCVVVLGVSNVD
jgi:hypothetical protein